MTVLAPRGLALSTKPYCSPLHNTSLSQALLGLPPLVTECTNLEASLTAREDSRPLLSLKPSLPLLVQPFTTLCRARHQGDTQEADKMVNEDYAFVPKIP